MAVAELKENMANTMYKYKFNDEHHTSNFLSQSQHPLRENIQYYIGLSELTIYTYVLK